MTDKRLTRIAPRVLEAMVTGITVGIMEFMTTWLIRSLEEIPLRSALIMATPIAAAISLLFRALLKRRQQRPYPLDSLTRPGKVDRDAPARIEFMSKDYVAELEAKFYVNQRPGDYLRFIEEASADSPDVGGKHG